MAYEQKNGELTVWKHKLYETGGKYPYATGTGKDQNGNDIEVVLWIPKSEKITGFNVVIKPYKKEEKQQTSDINKPDSDLPF